MDGFSHLDPCPLASEYRNGAQNQLDNLPSRTWGHDFFRRISLAAESDSSNPHTSAVPFSFLYHLWRFVMACNGNAVYTRRAEDCAYNMARCHYICTRTVLGATQYSSTRPTGACQSASFKPPARRDHVVVQFHSTYEHTRPHEVGRAEQCYGLCRHFT